MGIREMLERTKKKNFFFGLTLLYFHENEENREKYKKIQKLYNKNKKKSKNCWKKEIGAY